MKTLGRILIILAAFVIVAGVTYVTVNAGSSSISANMRAFERGGERGPQPEGMQSQFSNGERPEFPEAEILEFQGRERPGLGGVGWVFGFAKNIGIIAMIVALITVPKKLLQRKPAPIATT